MTTRSGWGLLALALALAFFCTGYAKADNLYASIRGTVTDQSGAVVPNVKLTATNRATGITFSTVSGKDGAYSFLQLPIGNYSVKAEASGFRAYQISGIHLYLNQVYSLNPQLEVGSFSQELTVEANPVQVDTTNMQRGTTITGNQIVDMPLNGRDWTQLQLLQPGVVGTSDRFGGANGAYSANGNQTQQNSFLINGTDTNDAALNTALVRPSPDAIAEFNLISSTLNPEYGRNSGTIINAAIKNGTNQFHGDAFEFYRDTFLDAKSYFQKTASPFHQNQYGGTLGGPIVKNHAFFFFSYQGLHARQPQPFSVPTVLSAAERTGDFSVASGGSGPFTSGNSSPVPLISSAGVPMPAGTPYSTLFPTGVIPAADLNPLAVKLLGQFVPLPNGAGNTYTFDPVTTATDNQYLYRLDEKLRDSDSIWFYSLYETHPSVDTLPFTG
ncbi:MAG TPA: carboxypeptidase-like regulatory domain-containing protein, partial [Terriglobales bacterium]|nr:carboxypeptidase-like regulatory domain-containing protein [Terriglobales bacterium]